MLTGLYVPGTSWLHRMPPMAKLALLLLASTVLLVWVEWRVYLVFTVALVLLYVVTGLGVRNLVAQLWPLRWFVLLWIPLQFWQGGVHGLVQYVWPVLLTIGLASAVTLSTRTNDLLEGVVRAIGPLRRVGVDPERVGLAMALAIRQIPVLTGIYAQVREAQAARGAGRSARALAAPMLTRTLTQAQRVGEALAARGVDD